MRHIDCRRQDGSWSARPLRIGRLPAFHHTPSVVAAALDAIEHFPQFPADIANPQIAGLLIEAHPPRIAKTVRPDLAASPLQIDERIVGRNAVVLAVVGVIDVDPQNARQEVADILPRSPRVGWIRPGAVSRGDIQTTVGTKLQTAAVMTAGEPGDDRRFARHLDRRRVGVRHAVPRDVRAVFQISSLDVADVAVPVLRKVGMKGECIDLHTGNRFGQVDHQVCRRDAGRVWKRKDLARLLDDEQPVAARCVGQVETIGEFEGRKSPLGHVGQRHFGRPDDAR